MRHLVVLLFAGLGASAVAVPLLAQQSLRVCGGTFANGHLYQVRCGGQSVEILDPTTNGVLADVQVPCCTAGPITTDPLTGTVYVFSEDLGTELWTVVPNPITSGTVTPTPVAATETPPPINGSPGAEGGSAGGCAIDPDDTGHADAPLLVIGIPFAVSFARLSHGRHARARVDSL